MSGRDSRCEECKAMGRFVCKECLPCRDCCADPCECLVLPQPERRTHRMMKVEDHEKIVRELQGKVVALHVENMTLLAERAANAARQTKLEALGDNVLVRAHVFLDWQAGAHDLPPESHDAEAVELARVILDAQDRGRKEERARAALWEDVEGLPEDAAIRAAHPVRSGEHEAYAEAMRLVGARRSKGALVALVTWLLVERNKLKADFEEARELCDEALRSALGGLDERVELQQRLFTAQREAREAASPGGYNAVEAAALDHAHALERELVDARSETQGVRFRMNGEPYLTQLVRSAPASDVPPCEHCGAPAANAMGLHLCPK